MEKRGVHRLTAKRVENEKAPGRYADGGGLYLQVGPTRTKSWLFRFTLDGKAREMGLGAVHTVELKHARAKAQACRLLLLDRMDPIEANRARMLSATVADAKSKLFKECAEAYIEAHRSTWKSAKHAAQWTSTLETYCYPAEGAPVWRHLRVSDIDTGRVLEVLEPIWKSKRETASRLRGRIEKILDWATVREYREGLNPARWKGHLDHTLPKQSRSKAIKHHAALPYDEAPAFLKRLRTFEGVSPLALQFIIFTVSRTGEAIGARWPEINERARCWTVPAERMKSGREHKVPLSAPALEILATVKPFATGDWVFPSSRGEQPLSNMACLEVLRRMGREDITVHGFRSTFRDWAEERTSFPSHVAEMALAHAIGDKVEAAYRRGDLFEKRRKLMDAWAEFCTKAVPASVHSISERRAAKK